MSGTRDSFREANGIVDRYVERRQRCMGKEFRPGSVTGGEG